MLASLGILDQSAPGEYRIPGRYLRRALAVCDLEISIDGRTIFRREMTTGTQHNWEQITAPIASGEHMLVISEVKTQTRKTKVLNIDRELWIVVTFVISLVVLA